MQIRSSKAWAGSLLSPEHLGHAQDSWVNRRWIWRCQRKHLLMQNPSLPWDLLSSTWVPLPSAPNVEDYLTVILQGRLQNLEVKVNAQEIKDLHKCRLSVWDDTLHMIRWYALFGCHVPSFIVQGGVVFVTWILVGYRIWIATKSNMETTGHWSRLANPRACARVPDPWVPPVGRTSLRPPARPCQF